jgi:predicted regulator of Ras-like GTPase activity (Roadblock/LC7/MglB family)
MAYEDATQTLKSFCDKTNCSGAFAATRSGNFICGILPEGQHRDTFVAMTAIVHGGAETISMEIKKPLERVTIKIQGGYMSIFSLGTKAILALTGEDMGEDVIKKVGELVKDLEKFIQ